MNNYPRSVSSFPLLIPPPALHSFFYKAFSGMVVNFLTSKCTNLSCSTLTGENICVIHTPCYSAHSLPPIKFPDVPAQSIPGPPHSPEATAFLICFLHRLVLPVWELHINGMTQKVVFCVRFISLRIMCVNTKRRVLKFSLGQTVQTRLHHPSNAI